MTNTPDSNSNRIDRLEINLEKLTNTVTDLSTTVKDLSTTVTDLSTTVKNLSTTVSNLSTTVTGISVSVANLNNTVAALVRIVEVHQVNHETSQRNFEIIVNRIDNTEAEIRGLRTESLRILDHLFGPQGEN